MEAFDFDNVMSPSSPAAEKPTDNFLMFSYHFKSIARLFRIVEILVGVAFLSWTSSYLPFAVRISGEYLRQLLAIVISPLFIFLVGNLIVVTLLLKAGHFLSGGRSPALTSAENLTETGLYEEFIQNHDASADFSSLIPNIPAEVVYEDKQTILESSGGGAVDKIELTDVAEIEIPEKIPSEPKAYTRTQSEHFQPKVQSAEKDGKLRRWETLQSRKVANPGEIPAETVYVFDELSNEEFNQTIEAFIAKQINFHREEQFAIVSSS